MLFTQLLFHQLDIAKRPESHPKAYYEAINLRQRVDELKLNVNYQTNRELSRTAVVKMTKYSKVKFPRWLFRETTIETIVGILNSNRRVEFLTTNTETSNYLQGRITNCEDFTPKTVDRVIVCRFLKKKKEEQCERILIWLLEIFYSSSSIIQMLTLASIRNLREMKSIIPATSRSSLRLLAIGSKRSWTCLVIHIQSRASLLHEFWKRAIPPMKFVESWSKLFFKICLHIQEVWVSCKAQNQLMLGDAD